MQSVLQSLCNSLSLDLGHLASSYDLSKKIHRDLKESLLSKFPVGNASIPIDIVVFGSIARYEATNGSDLDYLVIAYGLPQKIRFVREILREINCNISKKLQLRSPGGTGMFGTVVSAPDLIECIGLERDTNLNHSRRLLLLEESLSVYQPKWHKKLLKAILERYLIDYRVPKKGVPRFLLNDVIRYWRTIAVDYQAKRWEATEPSWGLRYLKLLFTRKITFAGTMAALLSIDKATTENLYSKFSIPSLCRLASIYSYLRPQNQGRLVEVFKIYDEFIGALADEDFRERMKKIDTTDTTDKQFKHFTGKARQIQKHLQKIFFSSYLGEKSVKYFSF